MPGPDPITKYDNLKDATDWLAAHAARPETDILSVCTGVYLCGAAGLLKKGTKACGPRGLQGDLAKRFEGVQWLGEELRWVKDGNFWSSGGFFFSSLLHEGSAVSGDETNRNPGGVTNGNDLVAAYTRLSGRFPGPVAELGLVVTETGDRPQRYETGKAALTLGIVWQIVKAVFMGWGKKKAA